MAEHRHMPGVLLIGALVLVVLSGCARFEQVLLPAQEPRPPVGLMLYLETMHAHAQADESGREALLADLQSTWEQAPTTTNTLQLGLVLGAPGNNGALRERGQGLLATLLAEDDSLLEAERLLAKVRLAEARHGEARLARHLTEIENSRPDHAGELAAEREARETAERRGRTLEADNRALREALAEAEDKLEAIATIERSMRERE